MGRFLYYELATDDVLYRRNENGRRRTLPAKMPTFMDPFFPVALAPPASASAVSH